MHLQKLLPSLLLCLTLLACGSSDPASSPVVLQVPVAGSPQRGPSDAWVTVVEFGDFQCPFCRAEEPIVARVVATWPDDVRLVWKHLPLTNVHENAQPAALAATCARLQGKFWEMHDLLLTTALDAGTLLQDASGIPGLDLTGWQSCLTGTQATNEVATDVALALALGVPGTPTFVINGQVLVGAIPEEELRATIVSARAAAIASGIPRADYYETAVLGTGK